ncbi:MAG TPA: sigma-54 dependent transcriptional regulator [Polyangiaceae bacterium]|nr:sigma-54 dependent transcriptional regulator [Polyangiaceae bacterium]
MQEHTSQVRGSVYPMALAEPEDLSPVSRVKNDATRPSSPPPSLRAPMTLDSLVSGSAAMRAVLALLTRLAPTEVTLTVVGETGTGKDVLARAIHGSSARADGPFVVFDCGAVAANLAESELFGHERGSFTGALATRAGAFERASGGTLFLDEIGELPLDLQPRLLRALESRCVRRVGGSSDRPVDVRIVAATNRDLPSEVAAGRFRQDLFFRLAGAILPVPALRERQEDLPVLVARLLQDFGRSEVRLSEAAVAELARHAWPGNVRELKNTIACALALLDGEVLEPHHLRLAPPPAAGSALEELPLGGLRLHQIERIAIKQTLAQMNGNKSHTARSLGIAVSTLYEKLKKHGL